MYPRNATSPPAISATVVSATDGSPITSGVAAKYAANGGSQTAGGGTVAHQGNGQWGYVPTQAETAVAGFAVQFYHASAVGTGPTVSVITDPATTQEDPMPVQSPVGRLLARNSHAVNYACLPDPASGTPNWGRSTPGTSWFLSHGWNYRIRQTGDATTVKLYIGSTLNADLTEFRVQIWREIRANVYNLVAETVNLRSRLTGGSVNTLVLDSPLAVREGDFIGYKLTVTGAGGDYFYVNSGVTGQDTYQATSDPGSYGVAWESKTKYANLILRIQAVGRAPHVVGIGDSIMSALGGHLSGAEPSDIEAQMPRIVATTLGGISQNTGIGSETSANIAARITTDCINLRPRIAIIQGGVNDLAGGVSQATFIANWTTMLDACKAAGVEPVVCKIQPWTNGTNQQMQTRDAWNAALATLAASYPDAVVVDFDDYVGTFRTGGDPGNKWDIASAYSAGDGVHYNGLGYARMAQAILDALGKRTAIPQAAAGVADTGLALSGEATGLTAQQVRDAMTLAPTAGDPAPGSLDNQVDAIQAKTDLIVAGGITIRSPVVGGRHIDIFQGRGHPATEGLAIVFEDTHNEWGDYSTAVCDLRIVDRTAHAIAVSITGEYAAGPPKTITFEPTAAETADLLVGVRAYGFELVITPAVGDPIDKAWGDVTIVPHWP